MQPNLFMWGGLLKQLIDSDLHIILDHVTASKNARYNRNQIAGNKPKTWLSIPYRNFSTHSLISNLELNVSPQVQKSLINLFTSRYEKSPQFRQSLSVLEGTINSHQQNNAGLIVVYERFLQQLASLGLPLPQVMRSSDILLNCSSQASNLRGVHLVNQLLEATGAHVYLAAENTIKYANLNDYQLKRVMIQKFRPQEYSQRLNRSGQEGFIPNTSCLDALSFLDPVELISHLNLSNTWSPL